MKNIFKYFIILALVFSAIDLYAQKARIVDLKVRILSPAMNSSIKSPGIVELKFSMFNKGPDKIKLSDTIIFYPKSTDTLFKFQKVFAHKEVVAGDSDIFTFIIPFNSRYDQNYYNLGILQLYAYNFSSDSLRNEKPATVNDNKAFVIVKHRSAISEISKLVDKTSIKTYPSPANNSLKIETNSGNKMNLIVVSNAIGENIIVYNLDSPKDQFALQTNDFTNGIYFLTITTEQSIIRTKFMIQHQ